MLLEISLRNAIGNFIAQDMQPLSVVENKGFLELMKVANPQFKVPSRGYFIKKQLSSYCLLVYKNMLKKY